VILLLYLQAEGIVRDLNKESTPVPVHTFDLPAPAREKIKREGFPIISENKPGGTLGALMRARNA